MAKFYKQLQNCGMCKVKYVIDKEATKENYWLKFYCLACCKKYMKKPNKT